MNVIALLDENCARMPAAPALLWGVPERRRALSFAELGERSRRLATLFDREGLRPGDCVAVFLPVSPLLYEVMAALLRSALVPVFIDPALPRQALDEALGKLELRGFIGTPAACMLRWLVPALRSVPHAFVAGPAFPVATSLSDAASCRPDARLEPCADEARALLTFTSGSTGRPKGVIRTHGTLRASHQLLCRYLELRAGERHLATLPFLVFAYLAAGACAVLPQVAFRQAASTRPDRLAAEIRACSVNGLVATPFIAGQLAEYCIERRLALETLERVFSGGAPVLPGLLSKLGMMAPRARIAAIYGSTEAEPIAIAASSDFGTAERGATRGGRGLLVGRPVTGVAVRVLTDRWGEPRGPYSADEFEREQAAAGTSGEIVVAGPNVSAAYLDDEDNRRQKICAGDQRWHRTGDAGYFDTSGRLWLTGRCAARIGCQHGALYPLQVEAASAELPAVRRITLVPDGADRTVLVVEPAGDASRIDLRQIAQRFAWCHPDEAVLVRRMPLDRRHHAKLVYSELAAALARGEWLAREVLH